MPFTLSHAAAVLPLSRGPLATSALVAGSVAPDLPYVLPRATSAAWGPYSDFNLTYTHDVSTGVIAGVMVSLILLALFHQVLKWPLVALLPPAAAARLAGPAAGFRWRGGRRVAWIVVSAAIGVLTHLAWDALVHDSGPTGVLWWGSTAAGAAAILVRLVFWWRGATPAPEHAPAGRLGRATRWWTIAALATAGVVGAATQLVQAGYEVGPAALRVAVPGGMSGLAVALLLYAVGWRLTAGRGGSRTSPAAGEG